MPFVIESQESLEINEGESLSGNFEVNPGEKSEESIFAGYGKSALKGLIEGVTKLGSILGPIPDIRSREQQLKEQREAIDKLLPQKEESYGQRALRRGLGELPTMAAFPGATLQTLPRTIAAGFIGEAAKDLGLPEWAQTAAELTAYIGPDITRKLLSSGTNKEIISKAKQMGLTDEQIAPLIQPEFKQRWLSKISPKRGRTKEILKESKKGIGEAFEAVKKSPEFQKEITYRAKEKLFEEFAKIEREIPVSVQKKISEDIVKFVNSGQTGEDLVILHKAVNKATGKGALELSLYKEPIKKALKEISPEKAANFDFVNNLFERYYEIAPKLKPNLVDDLVKAAESIGLLGSMWMGDTSFIKKILLEKGARIGARELLLNPRLQQLNEKTLIALNQNKYQLAKKFMDQSEKYLNELDPSIGKVSLSIDEIKEMINQKKKGQK